jgi:hypothetical protein
MFSSFGGISSNLFFSQNYDRSTSMIPQSKNPTIQQNNTTKIQHNITQWHKTRTFDVVMKSLQLE